MATWCRQFGPRLPVLLSNQAKLEAKLESNPAFSHTTLQPPTAWLACLVGNAGFETCTNFYQIPRISSVEVSRAAPSSPAPSRWALPSPRSASFLRLYGCVSCRRPVGILPLQVFSFRRRGHAWHMDDEVLAAASALRATSPGGAALVLGGGFCGLAYATQLEPRASRRLDPLRDQSPHATNAPDPDRSATHTLA